MRVELACQPPSAGVADAVLYCPLKTIINVQTATPALLQHANDPASARERECTTFGGVVIHKLRACRPVTNERFSWQEAQEKAFRDKDSYHTRLWFRFLLPVTWLQRSLSGAYQWRVFLRRVWIVLEAFLLRFFIRLKLSCRNQKHAFIGSSTKLLFAKFKGISC